MAQLIFHVENQYIHRLDEFHVVARSNNYLYAEFTFSDDWVGVKTALFSVEADNGETITKPMLIGADGTCEVPHEVLEYDNSQLEVSAFCGNRVTANVAVVPVHESGYNDDSAPDDPTPDVYTQIINRLANVEQIVVEKATEAESWAVGDTETREGEETDNAKYYSEQASTSASAAATSASNASGSAETAASAATQALASESTTTQKASEVAETKTQIDNTYAEMQALEDKFEGLAATTEEKAQEAGTASENARRYAESASDAERSAVSSATDAAASAASVVSYTRQAAGYATNAQNYASAADRSMQGAATSERNASQSATNAATSATNASDSASDASNSASYASGYASEASQAKTDAVFAKNEAVSAKEAAETAQSVTESISQSLQEEVEQITTNTQNIATNTADIAQNTSDIADVMEDLNQITEVAKEEDVYAEVTLDTSDIRNAFVPDSVGNYLKYNSSTLTKVISNAFQVEANKTYRIVIDNAIVIKRSAERGLAVYNNDRCVYGQKYTNTTNISDTIVFTPTASGQAFLCLDANYKAVHVYEFIGNQKTISAIDLVARSGVEKLNQISESITGESVETQVELDLNYVKTNYRCADGLGNAVAFDGASSGFTSSSVTTCVAQCFLCEADKNYTLTIINGETPARIAARGTVVVVAHPTGTLNYGTIEWALHSTNTANAKDVVHFTPPVSGYVFFNLDANYQSIEVTVEETTTELTAIDKVARDESASITDFIIGGTESRELSFEQGTFDASLTDVESTDYYRTGVINDVSGLAICVKVDYGYSFVYGDGENALRTYRGICVIHPKTNNMRIALSAMPSECGFEIRFIKTKEHNLGTYDVIVAASNSTEHDKLLADIVCDGVNDEIDLQFAANWNFVRQKDSIHIDQCNVLLLPGTYNIDNFGLQQTLYGQTTVAKYAVMVGNDTFSNSSSYNYRVSIEGLYVGEHIFGDSSVRVRVTNAGVASLDSELENVLIGICRAGDSKGGRLHMNTLSLRVANVCIYTNGINNRIVALDAYTAGQSMFENCDIWSTDGTGGISASMIEAIPDGSIGIRAGYMSCLGVRQFIRGCRIHGFNRGIAICGEHFIVQDNLEIRCYYGFTVNGYPNGIAQHPNVFIGNSVEQCYRMGKFSNGSHQSTIVYIGGSVESLITNGSDEPIAMLPIEIPASTNCRGRIESDSLAAPYNNSFFEEGYGGTFEQTIYQYTQA